MWKSIKALICDWWILGVAVCVIVPFVYLASYQSSPSQSASALPSAGQNNETHEAQAVIRNSKPAPVTAARIATAQSGVASNTTPTGAVPSRQGNAAPSSSTQTLQTAAVTDQRQAAPPSTSAQSTGQASSAPQPTNTLSGGDAAAGRLVFRKCQACHSIQPGKNMVGPSLADLIDRKAGAEQGYSYSPAMKQANIVWTAKSLDAYLTDPQKVVPGNKMPFPGLKTDHDRADVIAFLAASSGGTQAPAIVAATTPQTKAAPVSAPSPPAGSSQAPQSTSAPAAEYISDARYTLRSGIAEGRMVYLGVGGAIDGKVNPLLTAAEGQVVQLTLINGEGAEHDIAFPDQDARSPRVTGKGASTTIAFRAGKSGDFTYFCSVPGHQLAGMQGQFIVTPKPPAQSVVEADISRDPTDLPPPITRHEPQTVRVDLLSVEIEGRLAEAATFGYWTFNGKVPGPFIRVRVGDTVDIHLKNAADSSMIHSVDFHATTGPGGGAASLQVNPGQEKSMTWKALVPGLYVYHCATPMVSEHIANGMYGLILVEPEGGMSHVDREFYVMQGEIYTDSAFGQHGSQEFSVEKLLNERPEYFVFNGSVGALTKLHPLRAKVGETVRLFFGVGGPNFTSSFHVIGQIFDKVYNLGGLTDAPLDGIQTVSVPPGGAVATELKLRVPGNYTIVDHALARMERGLAGLLIVEGAPNPDVYNGKVEPGMGH